MGQKTHPYGFRIGFNKTWKSNWYGKGKQFVDDFHNVLAIKDYIKKNYYHAGVSRIDVSIVGNLMKITVFSARPGIVVGRGRVELDKIKKFATERSGKEILVEVIEVRRPELDAQLVAESIAFQLEKRVAFRRAMKRAVNNAVNLGARGIKVMVAGRLGGAEIARTEWYLVGRLPLQTIKADIDYGFAEAFTTYGKIGVKVWIYLEDKEKERFSVQEYVGVKKEPWEEREKKEKRG